MKSIVLLACFFLALVISVQAQPQEDKSKRPSPPAEAKAVIDSAEINIYYSSPAVKGRIIWDALVPFGKIWRTGANEATVFETNKDLVIQGQKLPAGKYSLFTIPDETEWTFVFNEVWDQWGAFKYDHEKDVLRIKVPVEVSPSFNERMKFEFIENNIFLFWENVKVGFPVGYKV